VEGGWGVPNGEKGSCAGSQGMAYNLEVVARAAFQGLPERVLGLLHHPASRSQHAKVAVSKDQARL
jgi:hypothetical protein